MPGLTRKNFDTPDETRPFRRRDGRVGGDQHRGWRGRSRYLPPDWQWSKHVKPIAGTESCGWSSAVLSSGASRRSAKGAVAAPVKDESCHLVGANLTQLRRQLRRRPQLPDLQAARFSDKLRLQPDGFESRFLVGKGAPAHELPLAQRAARSQTQGDSTPRTIFSSTSARRHDLGTPRRGQAPSR
jgi:hypothetical protein